MEWLGTGFVLTIGGMRLRVRIAAGKTRPHDCAAHGQGPGDGSPKSASMLQPARRAYRVHPALTGERYLSELTAWIACPSISADPAYAADVRASARNGGGADARGRG